jgi:hypothetical protein
MSPLIATTVPETRAVNRILRPRSDGAIVSTEGANKSDASFVVSAILGSCGCRLSVTGGKRLFLSRYCPAGKLGAARKIQTIGGVFE